MSRKKKVEKHYDLELAFDTAESFFSQSEAVINDFRSAAYKGCQNLGMVVSSATLISLSIELYLKCLHIVVGNQVNETHRLWDLFKRLPLEIQVAIKENYTEAIQLKNIDLTALELIIYVGKERPESVPKHLSKSYPEDFRSVLLRYNDAFSTWRYIYERGEVEKFKIFYFEFQRLKIIGKIVREFVIHFSPKIK